jgi:hypothetical protein
MAKTAHLPRLFHCCSVPEKYNAEYLAGRSSVTSLTLLATLFFVDYFFQL